METGTAMTDWGTIVDGFSKNSYRTFTQKRVFIKKVKVKNYLANLLQIC